MRPSPDPPSLAESVTETGVEVNHGAHEPPLHAIELDGAVESGVTVKLVVAVRPALLVATTLFGSDGSVGEPVWLYVAVAPAIERDQPVAAAAKVYPETPDSPSVELAVTANWPFAAPGR